MLGFDREVCGLSRKVQISRLVSELGLVLAIKGKTLSSNLACRETYIRDVIGSRHR